jgi:cytochrome P450
MLSNEELKTMAVAADVDIPVIPVESPEFAADPQPYLEAARARHPWLARFSQGYVVHGYQACADLLADNNNMTCGFGPLIDFYGVRGTTWARFMEETLISVYSPAHVRLRGAVAHAFTPRRANQEREMMQRTITTLLDEWAPRGAFDFTEFASYFPVTVMCGLLGVSAEWVPQMRDALENQLKSLTLDPAVKPLFMAGWDVLWDFADRLVGERAANLDNGGEPEENSLLDDIIAATRRGDMDDVEARFMVLTILFAGYDTSKNQLSMTMRLLLDRPAMYERCAEDLAYCRRVSEESLRHSAIATHYREAVTDFAYDGVQFRKGEMIVLAPPLANRDPSVFAQPEAFDPERENNGRNIGFGRGPHLCIGQFIARNQLQEGLHLIAQRLRNPRLDGAVEWRPFLGAWGPKSLPIAFDQT